MRIIVDREKCSGLGICESVAPDFFEIGQDGVMVLLEEHITEDRLEEIREACEGCPTEALSLAP
jgi:ferredoxin